MKGLAWGTIQPLISLSMCSNPLSHTSELAVSLQDIQNDIEVRMYVYTCVCSIRIRTFIHVCMYVYMCVQYTYIHVCMYVCMYVHYTHSLVSRLSMYQR